MSSVVVKKNTTCEFSCPSCNKPCMLRINDAGYKHFRCHNCKQVLTAINFAWLPTITIEAMPTDAALRMLALAEKSKYTQLIKETEQCSTQAE